MNVLSCFDGSSCGQLALQKLGITFDGKGSTYYASEIDKYAIQVTQANFPNTIQVGDISKYLANPMYLQGRDVPKIDLIMGINSSLFSAQNRKRLYWTNIPFDRNIDDLGIVMQDILEDGFASDLMTNADGKSHCLTARYNGAVWWNSIERKQRTMVLKDNPTTSKDGLIRVGTADLRGHDSIKRVYAQEGKSPTLTTMQGGHREPKVAIGRIVNRRLDENGTRKDEQLELPFTRQLEVRADEKSNCLTTVQKDNVVVSKDMWRKLTPLECERLQTLPDNYTNHVSNSQRYKMIGNGWTVDVIAHILKGIQLDEIWHEMYQTKERV
jgi:site-specific DNA-cytosine methylase